MIARRDDHLALASLQLGRAVQLVWLGFAGIAVSMTLAGIESYIRLVATPCDRAPCLSSQLSSSEMQALLSAGLEFTAAAARLQAIITTFVGAFTLLVAGFGIWRRPTDPAVVLMSFVLTALGTGELVHALAHEAPRFYLVADTLRLVHLVGLAPCLCLIPDGRFRPPRLGWAVLAVALLGVPVALGTAPPLVSGLFAAAVVALGAGSLITRYRTLQPSPQRERVVWALVALLLFVGAQLIGRPLRVLPLPAVMPEVIPYSAFHLVVTNGMVLLIGGMACLAVALLHDELFQVELVLNRALVYGLLSVFVVGGYVLMVGYLSSVFQADGNLWLSLVATGIIAALFQPIREQVQRLVNQMLYGERDEPYTVVARLGRQLEGTLDPDRVLPTIAETVARALKFPYVGIAIGPGDEAQRRITYGAPPDSSVRMVTLPLTHQGVDLGQLVVAPRQGEVRMAQADHRLLEELARQAGAAVHAIRLADDLRRSREQLVTAREEERRRLRRNLHDGLGPALSSAMLKLGAARRLLPPDSPADGVLTEVRNDLRATVADVRRLVYDLRPPTLDQLGLALAIRDYAEQCSGKGQDGPHITVEAPEVLPPLPAAVEVAAYRIAQEALTNVVRHAWAHSCHTRIGLEEGSERTVLRLEIADDGVGLPAEYRAGVGLMSMHERAEELGGSCTVNRLPGGGTRVLAYLPLSGTGQ